MNAALMNKLRLSLDMRALLLEAPAASYAEELGLDAEAKYEPSRAGTYDFVLLFAENTASLQEHAPTALKAVKPEGLLWICYPKGASGLKSDLNRDRGWKPVNEAGWQGVSLVSLDAAWSAMRFRPAEAAKGSERSGRRASTPKAQPAVKEEVVTPDDLQDALSAAPEELAYFEALAPSHRKAYIRWIGEAKLIETRNRRIAETVDMLARKLKRPSDRPSV